MTRVQGSELVGAREGRAYGRLPRIPSERADIAHLVLSVRNLVLAVRESASFDDSHDLLRAAATAQLAAARAIQHRDQRDKRSGDRRLRSNR